MEYLSSAPLLGILLAIDKQDETWAEFSTLEVAACHVMHLPNRIAIRPNLDLKTRPKQLLCYLPLDIELPILSIPADIRLGWKGLARTNTLAYLKYSYITTVKSSITLAPLV